MSSMWSLLFSLVTHFRVATTHSDKLFARKVAPLLHLPDLVATLSMTVGSGADRLTSLELGPISARGLKTKGTANVCKKSCTVTLTSPESRTSSTTPILPRAYKRVSKKSTR